MDEATLLEVLAQHDELVRLCVNGQISFAEFNEKYDDFYHRFALDGHESDEKERMLLKKYARRIEPHQVIAFDILGQVCSDENAQLNSYKQSGRIGASEAMLRLKNVAL